MRSQFPVYRVRPFHPPQRYPHIALTCVHTPFTDVLDGETPPADSRFPALTKHSSDQEIDDRVKGHLQTIYHPMGTCALGDVLDSEFRVRGVKNMRVCDASVFPEPLGGMPSCTIYALAEMCADLIAESSKEPLQRKLRLICNST